MAPTVVGLGCSQSTAAGSASDVKGESVLKRLAVLQLLSSRATAPGEGKNYAWGDDHLVEKLSSADTHGLATVTVEQLKPGVGRNPPRSSDQTEVPYILEGSVSFKIGDQSDLATAGVTLYVPAGIAATVSTSKGATILVLRTPGAHPTKN